MTPEHENPFWSYEDLALFAGGLLPCVALAFAVISLIHFPSRGTQDVAFQFLFYALAFGVLYLLVARRYDRPLWRSLGYTFEFRGALVYAMAGPVLAISLGMLGYVLKTPAVSPIPNLITDRSSLIAVLIFAVLVGPIFEELVFRGFLFPLIARSLGSGIGIVLTAIPFALLHVVTYGLVWQTIVVVGLAGVAFGIARERAGSTVASALLHIGYNGTLFGVFLFQKYLSGVQSQL
jgi:membrane protease YdiL (CAAX protease family)